LAPEHAYLGPNYQVMWSRAPLFRLAIPFFCGLYLHPTALLAVLGILCGSLLILFTFLQYKHVRIWSYHHRHEGGVLTFAIVFVCGLLCGQVNEPPTHTFQSEALDAITALKITEGPSERNSSIRYQAEIIGSNDGSLSDHNGKTIWLYIKKDSCELFSPGNLVAVNKVPKNITGPQNPGEFDFQEYSALLEITGMLYAVPEDVQLIDSTCTSSLFSTVRNHMLATLDSSGLNTAQLGVIKALSLGYKDDLESAQKEDFTKAGAMHVLAVSGLHVGLIYMVLNIFIKVPPGFRKLRIIKGIIVISFIWLYAGITDFSPSVLRSSVMFTFLVSGDLLGRKLSTLNSIAASAFFLVCVQPNIIYRLGFQLSYLAVCGIVIFQPFLASLITSRFKPIRWAWDLTCVSIAAQLFTLPLTMFYFGHFPVYGILANLLIIPLATGLLYSSLLFSLLPSINWISTALEFIVDILSICMLATTSFVSDLPGSQLTAHLSDQWEMLLLLIMVVAMVIYLLSATKGWLYAFGIILLALLSWPVLKEHGSQSNPALCIHSFPKSTCISIFGEGRGTILAHEEAYLDSLNLERKIECGWKQFNIDWDSRQAQMLGSGITLIELNKDKYIVKTGEPAHHSSIAAFSIVIPHEKWNESYRKHIELGHRIVLDESISYYERNTWIQVLSEERKEFWDVREKGAFLLTRTDIEAVIGKYPRTSPTFSDL
jgi:competence protein ComEC